MESYCRQTRPTWVMVLFELFGMAGFCFTRPSPSTCFKWSWPVFVVQWPCISPFTLVEEKKWIAGYWGVSHWINDFFCVWFWEGDCLIDWPIQLYVPVALREAEHKEEVVCLQRWEVNILNTSIRATQKGKNISRLEHQWIFFFP